MLGAAQTSAAHEAALKVLNFKDEERLNENERYLWALSLGSHPNPQMVKSKCKYNDKNNYGIGTTLQEVNNK